VLLVSLSCPLPLLRTHPPSLLRARPVVCCFFVFAKMGATSTASGRLEVNPFFVWEAGWKEPLMYNPSFSCIRNLKILHSQPVAAISYILYQNWKSITYTDGSAMQDEISKQQIIGAGIFTPTTERRWL